MSNAPEILYSVGDRVRVIGYDATGTITYVDYADPEVAYKVEFDDRGWDIWVNTESTTLVEGAVTLTPEKAAEVREALEAIGWDRDDLGPLAAPEPPKRVVKATITLPDDGSVQYALNNIEAEAGQWHATIEFEG